MARGGAFARGRRRWSSGTGARSSVADVLIDRGALSGGEVDESGHRQTVENQVRELRQIGERRGWEVIEEYHDAGISGTKGREARPGLDEMLKDAPNGAGLTL
jgi:hypothetical protein